MIKIAASGRQPSASSTLASISFTLLPRPPLSRSLAVVSRAGLTGILLSLTYCISAACNVIHLGCLI